MTIQQANQYFAALPDGFADPAQLGALLPASVQQVQFVGSVLVSTMPGASRLLPASVWMASRWTKHCCAALPMPLLPMRSCLCRRQSLLPLRTALAKPAARWR